MNRPALMVLVLLLGGGLGCDSESGASRPASGKVSSAAQDFLGFARGESAGGTGAGGHVVSREVRYTVARSVLVPGPRPLRRVEIQVPLKIESGELEATLRAASRSPELGEAGLIEIWAYPGGLRHLCGPFGLFTLARDGKGVPRTDGLNERVLIEEKLGAELDLEETRAIAKMDAAAGRGAKRAAVVAAGVSERFSATRATALLEKVKTFYPKGPPPPKK